MKGNDQAACVLVCKTVEIAASVSTAGNDAGELEGPEMLGKMGLRGMKPPLEVLDGGFLLDEREDELESQGVFQHLQQIGDA